VANPNEKVRSMYGRCTGAGSAHRRHAVWSTSTAPSRSAGMVPGRAGRGNGPGI
jgi:hypothetical protein